MRATFLRPAIADCLERIAEFHARAVLARGRPVPIEHAREDTRGGHRGGESRAFLVGPVDDLDRCERLVASLAKATQALERGEYAKRAVELAAGRLGVEVA